MAIRATLTIVGLMNFDDKLFQKMVIPSTLNRDVLINEIMTECGDLELMYPDWDFMQNAIYRWSVKHQTTWQKLLNTTTVVYDPIANVDATIETSRSGSNSGQVTSENQVSAYNVETFQPESKTTTTPDTSWKDTEKTTRKGNIGVTSTQELIQREREVARFNVYDAIVESFRDAFCLGVY